MAVLIIDCYIGLFGTGFMQVLYLGRAPRTKETLSDFLKWRRVTRHPVVFRRLTGSQRTPGFGASQQQSSKLTLITSLRKLDHQTLNSKILIHFFAKPYVVVFVFL